MMKLKQVMALFFAGALLVSCGGEENKEEGDKKSSDNKNDSTAQVEEHTKSAEELALLKPSDVDSDTPISVTDLYNSMLVWKGKEVTIAGYVRMYKEEDSLTDRVKLVAQPKDVDYVARCRLKQDPKQTVKKEDLVIIRGIVMSSGYNGIELDSCEFVGVNKEVAKESKLNPYNIPDQPILAVNLLKAYDVWKGKEVTVTGYYHSTTTSKTKNNTTWRIDLGDPKTHKKKVGCRMKSEPNSDELNENRENVTIKGTIKGETFGRVMMEECELVK